MIFLQIYNLLVYRIIALTGQTNVKTDTGILTRYTELTSNDPDTATLALGVKIVSDRLFVVGCWEVHFASALFYPTFRKLFQLYVDNLSYEQCF